MFMSDASRENSESDPLPNRSADNPFAGLGLSGYGAAYGSPPFGPDSRNIGRGPIAEVTVNRVEPDDPRLRAMIQTRRAMIAACYQRELSVHPSVFGALQVQFDLRPDGALSAVDLRGPALPPALLACVRARFVTMRVPPALARLGHGSVRYLLTNGR